MSFKLHTTSHIRYYNDNGNTERWILPTDVPGENVKAIDFTELDESQREVVSEQYVEYTKYLKQHMKQAFSFEDWLSHTKNVEYSPKWRTFKPGKTIIIS